MEEWFRSNFEDPAVRTPYESEEGGYVYIWGGPSDARMELEAQFGDEVSENLIEILAEELSRECVEWTPIPTEDDYDQSLFDVVSGNEEPYYTYLEAVATIRRLMLHAETTREEDALRRLLLANLIAAMEAYLSDTFINTVLGDRVLLRRFVETSKEFQEQKIAYSQIFEATETASEKVKDHLLGIVWHNLARVGASFNAALDVKFTHADLASLGLAVSHRHDIVHRNGKRKDGTPVYISHQELEALIGRVTKFILSIEEQLGRRHPPEVESLPDF